MTLSANPTGEKDTDLEIMVIFQPLSHQQEQPRYRTPEGIYLKL